VAQYLVSTLGYGYDMDAILDVIDGYMDNIRSRCSWGYTTQYFVAGCYGAHVNNISYLSQKNSIRSKDIRYILNKVGEKERKRYNYDLLERTYLELMESDIDDTEALNNLQTIFSGKEVLVLVPGNSVTTMEQKISQYVKDNNPIVVSVNFAHKTIDSDYIFVSNMRRYRYWSNDERFKGMKKIITSNMNSEKVDNVSEIVSTVKLIKCGWEHSDNSTLMLLRLLDCLNSSKISIAGFDGYEYTNNGNKNYATQSLELSSVNEDPMRINAKIREMLTDFASNKKTEVEFITPSRFEICFKN
jgi:4-hydroxy 2-oxovalerate aldolase